MAGDLMFRRNSASVSPSQKNYNFENGFAKQTKNDVPAVMKSRSNSETSSIDSLSTSKLKALATSPEDIKVTHYQQQQQYTPDVSQMNIFLKFQVRGTAAQCDHVLKSAKKMREALALLSQETAVFSSALKSLSASCVANLGNNNVPNQSSNASVEMFGNFLIDFFLKCFFR